ncbi:MAG: dTMP kinase [Syntrophorhabdales bacterium]|jgi:dTMP kinase|nr:dTMP kinase [Syntrophorhabdales bacterium]
MFITFEGTEGCGKTTQINLLYEYLLAKGYKVIKTREPGGTPLGESIRKMLIQKAKAINPLAELLLMMAMRAQHVEDVIVPAITEKKIVLCDRFSDATYAYQGYGRGIDTNIIDYINRLATKGIMPDLTILIDIDIEGGLRRKSEDKGQMDRFEVEDISFHQRIRYGYHRLSTENKDRFFVVDGSGDILRVHEIIRERIERHLE